MEDTEVSFITVLQEALLFCFLRAMRQASSSFEYEAVSARNSITGQHITRRFTMFTSVCLMEHIMGEDKPALTYGG